MQQTNPSDPSSFWSKVRWTLLAVVGGLVALAIALQGLHQKPAGDTLAAPPTGSVEPSTAPVPGAAPTLEAPAGDGGRSTNFNLN